MPELGRTLYCDPGEAFGWCIGRDVKLLAGGTTPLWQMVDDIWQLLSDPRDPDATLNDPGFLRDGIPAEENLGDVVRIVCEDFRIYPWKAKDLAFDPVVTARGIGAIYWMAKHFMIPMVFQGAFIKEAAKAAGAEELYWRPLRENRHQNDALQHFVFFTNVELMGVRLPVPEGVDETIEVYH